MNKMIIGLTVLCLLCMGIVMQTVMGKMAPVNSQLAFDKQLDKKSYALGFFYEDSKALKKDREYQQQIKQLKKEVIDISNNPFYKKGDLQVLDINITKNDLDELADDFGVTQTPAFVLFKESEAVRDEQSVALLQGFTSKRELKSFINDHLEDDLTTRAEEKEEACQRARSVYYGPYYFGPCGWPYYDNYPYCGYPYYSGQYYYGPGYGGYVNFGFAF